MARTLYSPILSRTAPLLSPSLTLLSPLPQAPPPPPGKTAVPPPAPGGSSAEALGAAINAKGAEIRDLKAAKADKAALKVPQDQENK